MSDNGHTPTNKRSLTDLFAAARTDNDMTLLTHAEAEQIVSGADASTVSSAGRVPEQASSRAFRSVREILFGSTLRIGASLMTSTALLVGGLIASHLLLTPSPVEPSADIIPPSTSSHSRPSAVKQQHTYSLPPARLHLQPIAALDARASQIELGTPGGVDVDHFVPPADSGLKPLELSPDQLARLGIDLPEDGSIVLYQQAGTGESIRRVTFPGNGGFNIQNDVTPPTTTHTSSASPHLVTAANGQSKLFMYGLDEKGLPNFFLNVPTIFQQGIANLEVNDLTKNAHPFDILVNGAAIPSRPLIFKSKSIDPNGRFVNQSVYFNGDSSNGRRTIQYQNSYSVSDNASDDETDVLANAPAVPPAPVIVGAPALPPVPPVAKMNGVKVMVHTNTFTTNDTFSEDSILKPRVWVNSTVDLPNFDSLWRSTWKSVNFDSVWRTSWKAVKIDSNWPHKLKLKLKTDLQDLDDSLASIDEELSTVQSTLEHLNIQGIVDSAMQSVHSGMKQLDSAMHGMHFQFDSLPNGFQFRMNIDSTVHNKMRKHGRGQMFQLDSNVLRFARTPGAVFVNTTVIMDSTERRRLPKLRMNAPHALMLRNSGVETVIRRGSQDSVSLDHLIPIRVRNSNNPAKINELIFWYDQSPEVNDILPNTRRNSVASTHDAMKLSVYPNPTTGPATIQYDLKNAAHASFVIQNLLGQKVMEVGTTTGATGEQQLDLSGLESGVYLLVTTTDTGAKNIERIVVTK